MKTRFAILGLSLLCLVQSHAQKVSDLPRTNRVELNTLISASFRTGPGTYATWSIPLSNVLNGTFTNLLNQYISNVVVNIVTNNSSGNYIATHDGLGYQTSFEVPLSFTGEWQLNWDNGTDTMSLYHTGGHFRVPSLEAVDGVTSDTTLYAPTVKALSGFINIEAETSSDEVNILGVPVLENLAGGGSRGIGVDNNGQVIAFADGGGWTGNANQFNTSSLGTNIINGAVLTNTVFYSSNSLAAARIVSTALKQVFLGTNGAIFISFPSGVSGANIDWGITNSANLGDIPSFTGPGFSVSVGANNNGIVVTSTNLALKGGGNALFWGGQGIPTGVQTDDASCKIYLNTMGLNAVGLTNSGFPNLVTSKFKNGADTILGVAGISTLTQLLLFGNDTTSKSATLTNATTGLQVVDASMALTNLIAKDVTHGTNTYSGTTNVRSSAVVGEMPIFVNGQTFYIQIRK